MADGSRRWRRLLILVAVAMVIGIPSAWAFWQRAVTINGVALDTGELRIQVNGANPFTGFTSLGFGSMVPGGSTAGVLTVTNTGTVPLSYYVDAAAGNADGLGLGAALVTTVTNAASVTGTAPSATCGGTTISPSATSFTTNFVGARANRRVLAPGASETLCIQASLPTSAPATLAGATTNVTFVFHALQVGAP